MFYRSPQNLGRRLLLAVLALAYPLMIYLGITRWGARSAGFFIVAAAACVFVGRVRGSTRQEWTAAVVPFLPALGLGLAAGLIGDERLLLALPALVSLSLLLGFSRSLRAGSTPMIQRFAEVSRRKRGTGDDLPQSVREHCRRFTWVWVVFLASNAAIAGGLALASLMDWWLLYACGLSYVLMGLIFVIERLLRPSSIPQTSNDPSTL